jgi:hypothetical protein
MTACQDEQSRGAPFDLQIIAEAHSLRAPNLLPHVGREQQPRGASRPIRRDTISGS